MHSHTCLACVGLATPEEKAISYHEKLWLGRRRTAADKVVSIVNLGLAVRVAESGTFLAAIATAHIRCHPDLAGRVSPMAKR